MRVAAILLGAMLAALTCLPAAAIDPGTGPTLDEARVHVENENWPMAVRELKRVVADAPEDPDALNLLAYALRHTGDSENARGFYLKALSIDPDHLGANEYLGELHVALGEREAAEARLVRIAEICGNRSCEAYVDLAAAIAAAP